MKRTGILLVVQIFCVFILLASCAKNNTEEMMAKSSTCDSVKSISYQNDVQVILNNNCGAQAGCHSNGSASGGVKLESWSGTHEVAASELLLKAIRHENGVSSMPKGASKLDDCYIAIIAKWVRNGSLNN